MLFTLQYDFVGGISPMFYLLIMGSEESSMLAVVYVPTIIDKKSFSSVAGE